LRRRWIWVAVLALGLTVSFATMARRSSAWKALISVGYPDVRWVDGETLSRWMNKTSDEVLVLVDARTPDEQQVSQVVVYCSIGYRSAIIVEQLTQAGVQNVYNLDGGLFEWANQDRPIYRGEEQVHEVHRFNRIWGLLLRRDLRAED
jgi:rhodanese-related sulfurtransferase